MSLYKFIQISEISYHTDNFRVLALSATPGNDFRSIQNVIKNLNIAKIESRTEDDPDVVPYINQKQIEVVKCKLGAEYTKNSIKQKLIQVMEPSCQYVFNYGYLNSNNSETLNIYFLEQAIR